jgi:hypothetical protein
MISFTSAGYERTTERQLYVLELGDPDDLAAVSDLPDPHFACFIAWDARNVSTEGVAAVVERLLSGGAASISAWGPDCERVHNIADNIRSSVGDSGDRSDSVVMTTWHDNESLEDALWFFLFNTFPSDWFEQTTRSGLAVIVGNRDWAAAIREGLRDPEAFALGRHAAANGRGTTGDDPRDH